MLRHVTEDMLSEHVKDNGLFKSETSAMCFFCVKDFYEDDIVPTSKPAAKFTLRSDKTNLRRSKQGDTRPATQSDLR